MIQITFDLPKQAATPKFGIQVVLTTEPKPVTVCETEPSCKMYREAEGLILEQYTIIVQLSGTVMMIVKFFVPTSGQKVAATVNVVFGPVRTRC